MTGAEAALGATFGLAILILAGSLIRNGSADASGAARRALAREITTAGPLQTAGLIALPRAEIRAVGTLMQPGPLVAPWPFGAPGGGGHTSAPADDGCGDPEPPPERGASAPDPVVTGNAPLVYLHPDEGYGPMSAQDFINHSELRWAHDSGCSDEQAAARCTVSAGSLGSGGYSESTTDLLCLGNDDSYSTTDNTRPRGGGVGGEGFFLDLDNDYRGGTGTDAPVYYDYAPGKSITYWFFYGYSQPPGPDLVTENLSHEGDWESTTILLDAQNRPTQVVFYSHGDPCSLPYDEVAKSGNNPIIYSAEGSHASYPTAGSHGTGVPGADDRTDKGAQWSSWKNLRDVRQQPWYGFGGAWGEVGNIAETTGPSGPSPYKSSVPDTVPPRCT